LCEAMLSSGVAKVEVEPVWRSASEDAAELGAVLLARDLRDLGDRAGFAGVARPELPLTAREFEVLRLVAEGRTSSQIGEELFISPKTAGAHVSNILTKLGVSRRIDAAGIARRLGLYTDDPTE